MSKNKFYFDEQRKFEFKDFNTDKTSKNLKKDDYKKQISENILELKVLQDAFFASQEEAVLIIFQAMDAAGKDGAIKHVMSGLNPQGVKVFGFKQPNTTELAHDFLWRTHRCIPKRGEIGIFNRSYYEGILVEKVHDLYNLPKRCTDKDIIKRRYEQIVNYEKYLWENGVTVIKFFLCISKEEQKKRFLARIDNSSKNWKISKADIKERKYWDKYMKAYEMAINKTSRKHAPWYVIPSDRKWYARSLILDILIEHFKEISPEYPKFSQEKKGELSKYRKMLED